MGDDNLNLRDFVRSALLDVLVGIRDAQADQTLGRFIAPVGIGSVEFPSARWRRSFSAAARHYYEV